eukprot:comp22467_c0_seq1/m.55451 comp22467_c0_seq1/g.55451  ORF comp22467_c0_seq1/g.55451 comp22467_c0_seq1/m.55451 type:complete len:1179 (+) comp22467_c0_seq1:3-3539(+)
MMAFDFQTDVTKALPFVSPNHFAPRKFGSKALVLNDKEDERVLQRDCLDLLTLGAFMPPNLQKAPILKNREANDSDPARSLQDMCLRFISAPVFNTDDFPGFVPDLFKALTDTPENLTQLGWETIHNYSWCLAAALGQYYPSRPDVEVVTKLLALAKTLGRWIKDECARWIETVCFLFGQLLRLAIVRHQQESNGGILLNITPVSKQITSLEQSDWELIFELVDILIPRGVKDHPATCIYFIFSYLNFFTSAIQPVSQKVFLDDAVKLRISTIMAIHSKKIPSILELALAAYQNLKTGISASDVASGDWERRAPMLFFLSIRFLPRQPLDPGQDANSISIVDKVLNTLWNDEVTAQDLLKNDRCITLAICHLLYASDNNSNWLVRRNRMPVTLACIRHICRNPLDEGSILFAGYLFRMWYFQLRTYALEFKEYLGKKDDNSNPSHLEAALLASWEFLCLGPVLLDLENAEDTSLKTLSFCHHFHAVLLRYALGSKSFESSTIMTPDVDKQFDGLAIAGLIRNPFSIDDFPEPETRPSQGVRKRSPFVVVDPMFFECDTMPFLGQVELYVRDFAIPVAWMSCRSCGFSSRIERIPRVLALLSRLEQCFSDCKIDPSARFPLRRVLHCICAMLRQTTLRFRMNCVAHLFDPILQLVLHFMQPGVNIFTAEEWIHALSALHALLYGIKPTVVLTLGEKLLELNRGLHLLRERGEGLCVIWASIVLLDIELLRLCQASAVEPKSSKEIFESVKSKVSNIDAMIESWNSQFLFKRCRQHLQPFQPSVTDLNQLLPSIRMNRLAMSYVGPWLRACSSAFSYVNGSTMSSVPTIRILFDENALPALSGKLMTVQLPLPLAEEICTVSFRFDASVSIVPLLLPSRFDVIHTFTRIQDHQPGAPCKNEDCELVSSIATQCCSLLDSRRVSSGDNGAKSMLEGCWLHERLWQMVRTPMQATPRSRYFSSHIELPRYLSDFLREDLPSVMLGYSLASMQASQLPSAPILMAMASAMQDANPFLFWSSMHMLQTQCPVPEIGSFCCEMMLRTTSDTTRAYGLLYLVSPNVPHSVDLDLDKSIGDLMETGESKLRYPLPLAQAWARITRNPQRTWAVLMRHFSGRELGCLLSSFRFCGDQFWKDVLKQWMEDDKCIDEAQGFLDSYPEDDFQPEALLAFRQHNSERKSKVR